MNSIDSRVLNPPIGSEQAIAQENERLRSALYAAGVGTWDYDFNTQQAQWSAICKELFGLPATAEVTSLMLLEQVHPDERDLVAQANQQALHPLGTGEHDITFRTRLPTGEYRWLRAQGKTLRDEHYQLLRFSGIVQEVTQQQLHRHEMERQVAQRTEQLQLLVRDLQRSNENLQQFAYVASHDLQEPLRKVQQFGDLLISDYSAVLGDGVNYLVRMQKAASRMSTLIKDLLSYSRIATQQQSKVPVLLDNLLAEVVNDLDMLIQETGATIQLEPLPTVYGESSQLRQLFQNLLNNALKFQAANNSPEVVIRSRVVAATDLPTGVYPEQAAAAYYRIDVADNGIGFEQKYVDRIFQVFQRLHGKDQYTGTGIGLAICQKVVANHGGVITAWSKPGQGTTFCVYLPAGTAPGHN